MDCPQEEEINEMVRKEVLWGVTYREVNRKPIRLKKSPLILPMKKCRKREQKVRDKLFKTHNLQSCEKRKLKKRLCKKCQFEPCQPRLKALAAPKKRVVLHNWKLFQHVLPPERLMRFDHLLKTFDTKILDPKSARYYFKQIDKRKRRKLQKRRRQLQQMRNKRKGYTDRIRLLVDKFVDAMKGKPPVALNYRQMVISEALLNLAVDAKFICCKPKRTCKCACDKCVVEIADKLAEWIDTSVQVLELGRLKPAAPSYETIYIDEESEEEEEEQLPEEEMLLEFGGEDEDLLIPPYSEGEGDWDESGEDGGYRYGAGAKGRQGGAGARGGQAGGGTPAGGTSDDERGTVMTDGAASLAEGGMEEGVTEGSPEEGFTEGETDVETEGPTAQVPAAGAPAPTPSGLPDEEGDLSAGVLDDGQTPVTEVMNLAEAGAVLEAPLSPGAVAATGGGVGATPTDQGVDFGGALFDQALTGQIDIDLLDKLIGILSLSPDDFLEQMVNADTLPGVRYKDILDRLKQVREGAFRPKDEPMTKFVEQIMIDWAKKNEPDKVDTPLLGKINEMAKLMSDLVASGIITEDMVRGMATQQMAAMVAAEAIADGEEGGGGSADQLDYQDFDETEYEEQFSDVEGGIGDEEGEAGAIGGSRAPGGAGIMGTAAAAATGVAEDAQEAAEMAALAAEMYAAAGFDEWEDYGGAKALIMMGEDYDEALDAERQQQLVMEEEKLRMQLLEGGEEGELPTQMTGEVLGLGGRDLELTGLEGYILGHKPSVVYEHDPNTICCLSLKIYAVWLLQVAQNAQKWTQFIIEIVQQVKYFVSIIRGDVLLENGERKVLYKCEWRDFSERTATMTVAWQQYNAHVQTLSEEINAHFHGKAVTCCPKCLQDHLIKDVTCAHETFAALTEAINCAGYWQECLNKIMAETARLGGIKEDKFIDEEHEDDEEEEEEEEEPESSSGSAEFTFEEISVSSDGDSVYDFEEIDQKNK